MKGLLQPESLAKLPTMAAWLSHAEATRWVARQRYADRSEADLLNITIQENVLMQLENLRTHPAVAVAAAGNSKNQFRVLVVPDEDSPPWPSTKFLRQGTRANGWVLLDQVGLGYEAWRRLNGFPPTVALPEPSSDGSKQDKGK